MTLKAVICIGKSGAEEALWERGGPGLKSWERERSRDDLELQAVLREKTYRRGPGESAPHLPSGPQDKSLHPRPPPDLWIVFPIRHVGLSFQEPMKCLRLLS